MAINCVISDLILVWDCTKRKVTGDSSDKQRATVAVERHFANWNGTGWRVFFSPFNRNTQRVYPRVPGAPAKRGELARTNGKEILLGVGARKFIAAPAVESRRPREHSRPTSRGKRAIRGCDGVYVCLRAFQDGERKFGMGGIGERSGWKRKMRKVAEDVGEWVIEEREQWTSRGRNWLVDVEVLERRVLGKRVRERK